MALLFSLLLVLLLAVGYLLLRNLVILPYINEEVLATQIQELHSLRFQIQARQAALRLLATDMASDDQVLTYLADPDAAPNQLPLHKSEQLAGLFLYDATLQKRYESVSQGVALPLLAGDQPFRRARLMPLLHPHQPRSRSGVLRQGGEAYHYAAASLCTAMANDCGHGYLLLVHKLGDDFATTLAGSSGLRLSLRLAQAEDEGLPDLMALSDLTRPRQRRSLLLKDVLGQPALVIELEHTAGPPRELSRYEWMALVCMVVLVILVNLLLGHLLVRPMERGVAQIRAMERNQQFRPLRGGATISEFRQLANAFNSLMRMLSQQREKLKQLARTDPLTGLANRRAMEQFLEQEWRRLCRHHRGLAILMVDIDHFKQFNDHYGHGTGDEVLTKVARVLESLTRRGGELACRWGGEEYVMAVTEPTAPALEALARALQQRVHQLEIAAPTLNQRLTISIGIALLEPGQDPVEQGFTLERLMEEADRALYRVKAGGRNNFELWRTQLVAQPPRP
ncbi:diguanylate cyclase domain-containing protein [Ferrimonas balearica]|uniref:sensor domain-containing diguanylate cyclase n=1 Tax=Ferrimonas balearica TaxID=44012 RepID=UPI001C98EE47|nr:diguanylate cyclase [Ferrimonas balearica]MBY5992561.1 diguanylate cyclase [Ferrimonas balearica]